MYPPAETNEPTDINKHVQVLVLPKKPILTKTFELVRRNTATE